MAAPGNPALQTTPFTPRAPLVATPRHPPSIAFPPGHQPLRPSRFSIQLGGEQPLQLQIRKVHRSRGEK